MPVTLNVLSLSSPVELVTVTRADCLQIVFNTPTLTLASASFVDGFTDVTVANIFVVTFVSGYDPLA